MDNGELTDISYTVLVTCYNEVAHIDGLVQGLCRYTRSILIVDDGSTDGTVEVIRRLGVPALFHAENHGKGQAIRTGLVSILSGDSDYVLFMDGDGQHDPSDIPAFLEHAERGVDFICGNRMDAVADMPYKRFFTNRLGSWALSRIIDAHIPDTMVGYRMIRADLLRRLPLVSRGFQIETEILLRCFTHEISYAVVPVRTIYHSAEENKYKGVSDSMSIFWFSGALEAVEAGGVARGHHVPLLACSRNKWGPSRTDHR